MASKGKGNKYGDSGVCYPTPGAVKKNGGPEVNPKVINPQAHSSYVPFEDKKMSR